MRNRTDLLPEKSKTIYMTTFETFLKWKREHKAKSSSESVFMAYFSALSKKYQASTLWSIFSMLKTNLKVSEDLDIDKYLILKAFLKKKSEGFRNKKSLVFSPENVKEFLEKAPDHEHLVTKVNFIAYFTSF